MEFDLGRRAAAEALGTAFLLAAVVGSGIMAERLAGDAPALALLCNTLPTGAILVVMITALGPVSGAHLNPAVTFVFALRRDLPRGDGLVYVAAQLVGAVAGVWTAHLMFDAPTLMFGTTARGGLGQWTGEVVATFGLVATILGCLRFRPEAVPTAVGLYITSAYWFTSSTSFANPAVTIARALSDTFAGIRPADAPAFVLAQLIGAALAAAACGWLFAVRCQEAAPAARPRQART